MARTTILILLLLWLCGAPSAWGSAREGYIITKDGIRLTGFVGDIVFSDWEASVSFVNSLGSSYRIQAGVIRGFVYKQKGEYVYYESCVLNNRWVFLRVLYRDQHLCLFKEPEVRVGLVRTGVYVTPNTIRQEMYWLLTPDQQLHRAHRFNYKKKFRRLMQAKAPELALRVGTEGHRFRDIIRLVREYNQWCSRVERQS